MNDFEFKTADPTFYGLLKDFARKNRQNPTEAESLLWECLKERQTGRPFRRQHIIGCFIADFCCVPAKLVVEVDGGYHQLPQQQACDEERQQWLESKGFTVVRFSNEEVINNIESVLETIEKHLE